MGEVPVLFVPDCPLIRNTSHHEYRFRWNINSQNPIQAIALENLRLLELSTHLPKLKKEETGKVWEEGSKRVLTYLKWRFSFYEEGVYPVPWAVEALLKSPMAVEVNYRVNVTRPDSSLAFDLGRRYNPNLYGVGWTDPPYHEIDSYSWVDGLPVRLLPTYVVDTDKSIRTIASLKISDRKRNTVEGKQGSTRVYLSGHSEIRIRKWEEIWSFKPETKPSSPDSLQEVEVKIDGYWE